MSSADTLAKRWKRRLGPSVRAVRGARNRVTQAIDPTPLRAKRLWAGAGSGPAALICVYRSSRASFVEDLVRQASALDMKIALWALDSPVESLASFTLGSGAGLRSPLLNRLWEAVRRFDVSQLVVTDDDVAFSRGDLSLLLRGAAGCGFGIAQPAISRGWNHEFTRTRFLTLARLTSFVEVGPMIVVGKPWLSSVMPLPERFGMGWGLELFWQDLMSQGCRLGILDGVSIWHLQAAREYDEKAAKGLLKALMKSRNIERLVDIQLCLGRWRPWQREPSWLGSGQGDQADDRPSGPRLDPREEVAR